MKKIKNILILAGGDSTRFWPLKRKSFFSFLGKPILLHLVENVNRYAENLTIVVNPEEIKSFKRLDLPKKVTVIEQKKSLIGQAGAILSTKNKITGRALILNADDIFNFDIISRFIEISIQKNLDYLCLAKKVDSYFPGGYLSFTKNKLDKIIEKPPPEKIPSNLVKLVVDYFKDFDQLILALEKTKITADDQYEQAINILIHGVNSADHIIYNDSWYPLKYPWHILPMMHFFLKSQKEKVKLGKNVKIAKTAKIVGPCFIDDNTIVGDFALVRESHIGKDCVIGGYSEVTRSYLANKVSLHRNYVGDSVLDHNVQMGAEATTANFRFDEKSVKSSINGKKIDTNSKKFGAVVGAGSKIGVNATLLPGVKIGRNTFVGPGEIVYDDIEDDMFVLKGKLAKNISLSS